MNVMTRSRTRTPVKSPNPDKSEKNGLMRTSRVGNVSPVLEEGNFKGLLSMNVEVELAVEVGVDVEVDIVATEVVEETMFESESRNESNCKHKSKDGDENKLVDEKEKEKEIGRASCRERV